MPQGLSPAGNAGPALWGPHLLQGLLAPGLPAGELLLQQPPPQGQALALRPAVPQGLVQRVQVLLGTADTGPAGSQGIRGKAPAQPPRQVTGV